MAEKPPPLLTRQGWELAAPMAASSTATAGAMFGPAGLAAAGGVAAAAAGVSALRNRQKRGPAAAAAKKTAAAERRAAQATVRQLARVARQVKAAERRAARATGKSGGMPGLGALSTGRRGGATGGGVGRSAGSGGAARRAAGGAVGRAMGQLRGVAGRSAASRSSRTAGATPRGAAPATGSKRASAAAGSRRSPAGKSGGGLLGRLRGGGRGSGGSGGGSGRPGAGGSPKGSKRQKKDGGGPTSRRAARSAASKILRALGGRSAKDKAKRAAAGKLTPGSSSSSGGRPSVARRAMRRLTGRKPISLVKKRPRKTPGWVGRILGRKPKRKTVGDVKNASPVAKKAIKNAITTEAKGRRSLGDTMPLGRRPKINQTGLRVSSAGQLGSTPASGRNPFAAVVEAAAQAAQSYTPENAGSVIDWYEGMPEMIDAISRMLQAQGAKNSEDFYLYPAAGEFAMALGGKFQAYKGPCEEARHAFEVAHAEDLERLRNPKPHQEKWDLSKNPEVAR